MKQLLVPLFVLAVVAMGFSIYAFTDANIHNRSASPPTGTSASSTIYDNTVPPETGAAFGISPITPTELGSVSTLASAQQLIGVNFTLPTYLPTNTTLNSIRSTTGSVAVIYDNPNLASMPGYTTGKTIIFILKDNTTYAAPQSGDALTATIVSRTATLVQNGNNMTTAIPESDFVPNYQVTTISGNPGWGFDPITFSNGLHDSGRLDWWADGVHYSIQAELPMNTLIQIADSMQT